MKRPVITCRTLRTARTARTARTGRAARPAFAVLFVALCALLASCSGDGFGKSPNPPHLVVTLDPMSKLGTLDAPLELQIDVPLTFRVTVSAINNAGAPDATFNRYVRISSKPGAIDPLTGPDSDGRNILLKGGTSVAFDVNVTNAFGTTYIVADDLGYIPKDPLSNPPPQCSDGIDNDGDGKIDFPADEGCAFANDDSEVGGTYSEGASAPINFRLPRIAEVRGLKCDSSRTGCSGNGATPYPREQMLIDTGFRDNSNGFVFNTVVTRIASSGFYVTDLDDKSGTPPGTAGFNSVFAFNFNAPPFMRTCDRLKSYGGTASEFFGFTQISYPTWTLEEWDPAQRPCLVPAPERLSPSFLGSSPDLLKRSANLVRVETSPDGAQVTNVTSKFGPGDVQKSPGGLFAPTPDESNCDFDHNGKITFAVGNPENDCNAACTADPECTEWSNWIARNTFRLTVADANGSKAAIQADATAAAGFDPVAMKGKKLRWFAGTMSFFSGGAQFTIEVRCKDDIITDLTQAPFNTDSLCSVDDDCTPGKGFPAGFTCASLGGGQKACRKIDPATPNVKEPPPLACVFPRTFLDNNPQ
jgi:hypothetical protein